MKNELEKRKTIKIQCGCPPGFADETYRKTTVANECGIESSSVLDRTKPDTTKEKNLGPNLCKTGDLSTFSGDYRVQSKPTTKETGLL